MVDMDEVLTGDNFLKFLEIYLGKKLKELRYIFLQTIFGER